MWQTSEGSHLSIKEFMWGGTWFQIQHGMNITDRNESKMVRGVSCATHWTRRTPFGRVCLSNDGILSDWKLFIELTGPVQVYDHNTGEQERGLDARMWAYYRGGQRGSRRRRKEAMPDIRGAALQRLCRWDVPGCFKAFLSVLWHCFFPFERAVAHADKGMEVEFTQRTLCCHYCLWFQSICFKGWLCLEMVVGRVCF